MTRRTYLIHLPIALCLTAVVVASIMLGGNPVGAVAADSAPVATAGIDENTDPETASSPVHAIVEANGRYYVGGDFQTVAGESQPFLAAIEVATGRLDQQWRPVVNGMVTALAVSPDGTELYVGGRFNKIDDSWSSRIAKLDAATGAVDTSFDPDASAVVETIVTDGTSVWAGGAFQTIGGTAQAYLAKMDTAGLLDPAFDPVVDGNVLDLELDGNRLYLSGNFTSLDAITHERIASMDATTGVADPWSPSSAFKVYDVSLRPSGGILYAAGAGSLGAGGNSLTAWDTDTGDLLWRRINSGDFQAVVATDELVYIGTHGEYVYIDNDGPFLEDDANPNAVRRNKLAAFDPITGELDAWNPGANSVWGVWSLSLGPSGLLVGGDFTTIGGKVQPHFAVLDGPNVGNAAPSPDFTVGCAGSVCNFDASSSSDSDGITGYAWDFGDGQTAMGETASVTFDNNSMNTVSLTVTDNAGQTARTQNLVPVGNGGLDVQPTGTVDATAHATSVSASLPTDVSDGDFAVAFLAVSEVATTIAPPAGWTEVGTQDSGSLNSGVWYSPIDAPDAGAPIQFDFGATVKANLTIATFRNVDLASPMAAAASEPEGSLWGQHSAPSVTTTVDSTVLHYWADRTGDTDRVSGPGNEAIVSRLSGTGGGHLNSALSFVPTNGPGAFAESVAIGDEHTRSAVGWTVALAAGDFTPACVATLNADDTVSLEWSGLTGASNNVVRRNGSYLATVGLANSYVDTPGAGTWDYLIRVFVAGEQNNIPCAPQVTVTVAPFVQTCTATLNADDTITVTWTDIPDENGYSVRRNGSYLAFAADDGTYTDDPGAGTWDYIVRSKMNGITTDTSCGDAITIETEPFVQTCTATLNADDTITLDWDQIPGEDGYSVRRNGSYLAFVDDGLSYDDEPGAGTWDYIIRSRINGVTTNTSCGDTITIEVEPPAGQTCAATTNGDGSVTLTWDAIDGEDTYIVRRNNAWLETTNALTITDAFAEPGDSYVIRSNKAGVQTNTTCD